MSSRIYCVAIVVLGLVACRSVVPDQRLEYLRKQDVELANPAPTPRDFKAINANHKVLMAVFDTGIDYNHPQLIKNVHFDLDESGKPIGAGHDNLGLDNWASYRLVATDRYLFVNLPPEAKKEAKETGADVDYDAEINRNEGNKVCIANGLLAADPRLKRFVDPYRSLDSEAENVHGTHVAGLMTYDRADFGIIPYRVLPYYTSKKDEANQASGKADRFVTNLKSDIADAHKRGVKIINFSLGGSFKRPIKAESPENYEKNMIEFERNRTIIVDVMSKTLKQYPEILFVAAAGNDEGWSDNDTRVQYPCGILASNLLCVGAQSDDGRLTYFTNVPFNKVDFVVTEGDAIRSLYPHDKCAYLEQMADQIFVEDRSTNREGMCRYDLATHKWRVIKSTYPTFSALAKSFYETCSAERNQYVKMSGTSMATPLISHFAAEILAEKPSLDGAGLIKEIKSRGKLLADKSREMYEIKFKKPSWYKFLEDGDGGLDPATHGPSCQSLESCVAPRFEEDDNFSFVIRK